MSQTWPELLHLVVALGAGTVGGALWVFSVMVLPAFDRLRSGQAVAAFQQINQMALRGGFLSVFLGTALGTVAVSVLAIQGREEAWVLNLVGALLYLVAVAITAGINVPANNRLAVILGDQRTAPGAWLEFTRRWRPANHIRCLTALASAVLLAWP